MCSILSGEIEPLSVNNSTGRYSVSELALSDKNLNLSMPAFHYRNSEPLLAILSCILSTLTSRYVTINFV